MEDTLSKKVAILNASYELFQKFGFAKTSLDDIARLAGVGKGTIYYYFESKEDIMLEVLSSELDKVLEELNTIADSNVPWREKFRAFHELPLRLIYENAPVLIDLLQTIPNQFLQKLKTFREITRNRMRNLIKSLLEEGRTLGLVRDDIPLEVMSSIFFRWFFMSNDNIIVLNKLDYFEDLRQDLEYFSSIILDGVLKKGVNE